jgi:L-rhamnose mutarotase
MVSTSPTSSSSTFTATALLVGMALALSCSKKVEQRRRSYARTAEKNNLCERFAAPRRYGAAIRLHPEAYRRYRDLHDNVWDQVLDRMRRSHIRNFTIYYHEETQTLFQHFEWIGHWRPGVHTRAQEATLFRADMQAIAEDPMTKRWWKECEPCQIPFRDPQQTPPSAGGQGEWWTPLECVNHCGLWPTAYSQQDKDPDFVKRNKADVAYL